MILNFASKFKFKAFIKRLLQICFSQNVSFICGSFMLISEIMKLKSNVFQFDSSILSKNSSTIDSSKFEDDDDEEEKFTDVKSDDDEDVANEEEEDGKNVEKNDKTNPIKEKNGSWIHKKNIIYKKHDKYDYQERNPLYCGADKTLTFELLAFTKHYHPTVVVFANKLLNVTQSNYITISFESINFLLN